MIKEYAEEETNMKQVASKIAMVVPCLAYPSVMTMKMTCSSETWADIQQTI
jgi:hypothetical protein